MDSKKNKLQVSNKFHLKLDLQDEERRELQRREQSDRREIERFGYEKITRRSGGERRKNHAILNGCGDN